MQTPLDFSNYIANISLDSISERSDQESSSVMKDDSSSDSYFELDFDYLTSDMKDAIISDSVGNFGYFILHIATDNFNHLETRRLKKSILKNVEKFQRRTHQGVDLRDFEEENRYRWTNQANSVDLESGDVIGLVNNFNKKVEHYAKVIISELSLPNYLKSIKAIKNGGVSGIKYVIDGIIMKLAVDIEVVPYYWMYGNESRNDYLSSKGVSNDFRSSCAMYECKTNNNLSNVKLPISSCVQYMGYTIVATSFAPIDHNSIIVYGTQNAGKTYPSVEDPELEKIVTTIADYFNFEEHPVSNARRNFFNISLAADVEIHKHNDQYYIIDLGRFMVPNDPAAPFYHFFRPEYLKDRVLKPLSCDAFSGFGRIQMDKYNNTVQEEIETYFEYIENCFLKIIPDDLPLDQIKELLHANGINLRHMGRIRSALMKSSRDKLARTFLIEMILRSIKMYFSLKLSNLIRSNQGEFSCQELIFKKYKLITSFTEENFWQSKIKELIITKFEYSALSKQEQDNFTSLITSFDESELSTLRDLIPQYAQFTIGKTPYSTEIHPKIKNSLDKSVARAEETLSDLYQ